MIQSDSLAVNDHFGLKSWIYTIYLQILAVLWLVLFEEILVVIVLHVPNQHFLVDLISCQLPRLKSVALRTERLRFQWFDCLFADWRIQSWFRFICHASLVLIVNASLSYEASKALVSVQVVVGTLIFVSWLLYFLRFRASFFFIWRLNRYIALTLIFILLFHNRCIHCSIFLLLYLKNSRRCAFRSICHWSRGFLFNVLLNTCLCLEI